MSKRKRGQGDHLVGKELFVQHDTLPGQHESLSVVHVCDPCAPVVICEEAAAGTSVEACVPNVLVYRVVNSQTVSKQGAS